MANDDAFTTPHDTALIVDADHGLLVNDTDPDNSPAAIVVASTVGSDHGTVDVTKSGALRYLPDTGFAGTDQFTYVVSDGEATSAPATVTITVAPNRAPVANDDAYTTPQDTNLNVTDVDGLLANDTDEDDERNILFIDNVTDPSHGTLIVTADGAFEYVPENGFSGIDRFTYVLSDGKDKSAPATVTITVVRNKPPVANDDSYTTPRDTTLNVDALNGLLANDTDDSPVTLEIGNIADPEHGTVLVTPDGAFEYVPEAGFIGTDSFLYTVSDGVSESDEAIVTITVTAAPEPTETTTPEPTATATASPTAEPTEEPTQEPTQEPSQTATPEPTNEPTETATPEPTVAPTDEPTQEPTEQPTGEPTQTATPEPTVEPSATPSDEPTEEPTQEPSATPSSEPGGQGEGSPTPTTEPTDEPSATPTETPPSTVTAIPSATPGDDHGQNPPGNPNPGGAQGGETGTGQPDTGNDDTSSPEETTA